MGRAASDQVRRCAHVREVPEETSLMALAEKTGRVYGLRSCSAEGCRAVYEDNTDTSRDPASPPSGWIGTNINMQVYCPKHVKEADQS